MRPTLACRARVLVVQAGTLVILIDGGTVEGLASVLGVDGGVLGVRVRGPSVALCPTAGFERAETCGEGRPSSQCQSLALTSRSRKSGTLIGRYIQPR